MLGVISPKQNLLDVDVFFLRIVDRDTLRFTHDAGSQLLNAWGKRCAKHHGLLAANRQLVNFSQVIGEAQIEHPVGFINHQKLHLVQFDLHRTLKIKQAAWCCNNQVGVLQLGNLQLVRHTTHNIGNPKATAMLDQINRIMRNLLGQLAGWANNQSTRRWSFEVTRVGGVFALGALGRGFAFCSSISDRFFVFSTLIFFRLGQLRQQGMEHRQQKGRCFSTAGLARNHQVDIACRFVARSFCGQRQRNGLQLNGRRLGVTQIFDSTD